MGHNSIPPSRTSSQDPEERRTIRFLCEVLAEFEIKRNEVPENKSRQRSWAVSKFIFPFPNSPKFQHVFAQNINAGTVVPVIVNPESIPVDLYPEEDL